MFAKNRLKLTAAIVFAFLLLSAGVFSVFAEEKNEEPAVMDSGSNLQDQRAELENQLAELERQIAEQEEQIQKYGSQKKTLQGEINSLNSQIKKINLEIKSIDLTLNKVNSNITSTQKNINTTEMNIDEHRDAIAKSLRSLQETDRQTMVEIILANENLSDFFGNVNNIALVQDNLRVALDEITKLREDLIRQKNQLTIEKDDAENLKNARQNQATAAKSTQNQKNQILTVTKGKEAEYQKLLAQTKETAAQIRNRIFQLLGGGQLTFEQAYDYARLAEKATGVRAAFVLAILNQESSFGKNVGRCKYNEIFPKTGLTVMRPSEITIFEDLLNRLGVDKNSQAAYVSCPIPRDGSYGGAMGPSQFIPSTWKIYEKDVTKVTGNNPPNPWSNSDAFAATALYLAKSLESPTCKNYSNEIPSQRQLLLERCAAAQYYAGGRWYTYRWVYGEPVAQKAQKFQADINVLEGA